MPTIELWEKVGKGAFRVLHNIKRPVEVVALEDAQGNLYPIYEGNNAVPSGVYGLVIVRPYAKDYSEVFYRPPAMPIEVWNEDDVVYLVHVGEFVGIMGGYDPYKGAAWEKYANSNGDKLERPVGWMSTNAQRMILEANRRMR